MTTCYETCYEPAMRREYGTGGLSKVPKTRTRTLADGSTVTTTYDYWCASWSGKDDNGKRIFIRGYGTTPAEARRRLNSNLQTKLISGRTARPVRVATLSDYLTQWLEVAGDQNETSKHRNKRNLEAHVLPHLDKPINLITVADVQELFFKTLVKRGVTESSRYNAFASLRALLNFAKRMELIEKNPCAAVQVKKPLPKVREADDHLHHRRRAVVPVSRQALKEPVTLQIVVVITGRSVRRVQIDQVRPRLRPTHITLNRAATLTLEHRTVPRLHAPHELFCKRHMKRGPPIVVTQTCHREHTTRLLTGSGKHERSDGQVTL